MTVGSLFLYSFQFITVLNVVIAAVNCKRHKRKFGDSAHLGFSILVSAVIACIYVCIGIEYIFSNWDKVIF